MGLFKKIARGVSSLVPGGGIIKEILSPEKSPEQIQQGLASLDPIAQYNRTMARPRIALACVYSYLALVIAQWILKTCGVDTPDIPGPLQDFATIAVGFYMGSRGVEKIVSSIFKKKEKKEK